MTRSDLIDPIDLIDLIDLIRPDSTRYRVPTIVTIATSAHATPAHCLGASRSPTTTRASSTVLAG
jgi:hypothetical protein